MLETHPYLVGLAGGSASGKTSFIKDLKKVFNERELCVISQDNYYRTLSAQKIDENGEVNFDLPEAIDLKRLTRDVRTLRNGKKVSMVEYTFNNPSTFPKEITFIPAPIIIIEGLFIFSNKALTKLFDLTLFIEASPAVMFQRRLRRDTDERGIPESMIRYQWDNHFMPAYNNYMVPHKNDVDMVIMNNHHFKNSFEVLVNHFKEILTKN